MIVNRIRAFFTHPGPARFRIALIFTTLFCIAILPLNEHLAFSPPARELWLLPLVLKALFAILLFHLSYWLLGFVEKIRSGDSYHRDWLKYSLVYLFIMLVVFVAIYPGDWVWDEYFILDSVKHYGMYSWQNYLTNIYYTTCLYLVPTAVAIVVAQITFVSIVVGYIMAGAQKFLRRKAFVWVLLLVLLLPPIVLDNFYPLRVTLCPFIELLLIGRVLFVYLGAVQVKNKYMEFAIITLLVALVSFWRSEALYYLILLPVMAVRLGLITKQAPTKIGVYYLALSAAIISLVGFVVVSTHQDRYDLTTMVNPLAVMVQHPLKGTNIDQRLDQINQVISLDSLHKYPNPYEVTAFWMGGVRPDFERHLADFKKQYVYLVVHNPRVFLSARVTTFLSANGLDQIVGVPVGEDKTPVQQQTIHKFQQANFLATPFAPHFRAAVIRALLMTVDSGTFNRLGRVVWNAIPPIILLAVLGLYKLVTKQYFWAFLIALVLLRVPIIFLTAPANYFMYYLPIYVVGYSLVALSVIQFIDKRVATVVR